MSASNPYTSPLTDDQPDQPEAAIRRLPLGRVLLGMLLIPLVCATARLVLVPVELLLDWVQNWVFFGWWQPFWYQDLTMVFWQVQSAASMGFFNTLLFGGPYLLFCRSRGTLTPKRVLITGAVLGGIWSLFIGGTMVSLALSSINTPDNEFGVPPALQYAISATFDMLTQIWLPLVAGFAAYAWWIWRLRRKMDVDVEPGEA
ncbi:MAG: hypothetical protein AAGJ46_13265 [Planctomycetota bacterium]